MSGNLSDAREQRKNAMLGPNSSSLIPYASILHFTWMMLAKLTIFLCMYLLRYQTSIGKSENITDENLDKKREVDDCKKEPTILCIGWIAWWFSKSIWAIQFQVGSS